MWLITTERCSSMCSSDSRGWQQTCTWWPQRSGRFRTRQQIRNCLLDPKPFCALYANSRILKSVLWETGSQFKALWTGVMRSTFLVLSSTRAASVSESEKKLILMCKIGQWLLWAVFMLNTDATLKPKNSENENEINVWNLSVCTFRRSVRPHRLLHCPVLTPTSDWRHSAASVTPPPPGELLTGWTHELQLEPERAAQREPVGLMQPRPRVKYLVAWIREQLLQTQTNNPLCLSLSLSLCSCFQISAAAHTVQVEENDSV